MFQYVNNSVLTQYFSHFCTGLALLNGSCVNQSTTSCAYLNELTYLYNNTLNQQQTSCFDSCLSGFVSNNGYCQTQCPSGYYE